MRIAYFGGGYIGNIGNAFIELGGMEILRRCLNADDELYVLNPGDSQEYFRSVSNHKFFSSLYDFEADVAVFTGMVFCSSFLQPEFLSIFLKRNPKCKLLFVGGGVADYVGEMTQAQLRMFWDGLGHMRISVVSRDVHAYNFFKDKVEEVHRGIDVAAFLSMISIPKIECVYRVVCDRRLPPLLPDFDEKNDVVLQHREIVKPDGADYCSIAPLEYLYILGNASCVHSNRIHGVIPALAFGIPAKFYPPSSSDRHEVLEELPVYEEDGFLRMDLDGLAKRQEEQLKVVREFIHS